MYLLYTFFQYGEAFDKSSLDKNYKDNLPFYLELLKTFLSNIRNEVESLKVSSSNEEVSAVLKTVHKIKNDFYWIGLTTSHLRLKDIEASRDNSSEVIAKCREFLSDVDQNILLVQDQKDRLELHLDSVEINKL